MAVRLGISTSPRINWVDMLVNQRGTVPYVSPIKSTKENKTYIIFLAVHLENNASQDQARLSRPILVVDGLVSVSVLLDDVIYLPCSL